MRLTRNPVTSAPLFFFAGKIYILTYTDIS